MKKILFFFLFLGRVSAVSIISDYAVLIDHETGDVLFDKNSNERTNPSSMTKIMTSYLIFEKLENNEIALEDKIKVSKLAWIQEGSRMFLELGSSVDVDNLLKGMIVQSGNDAVVTLVEGMPTFDFVLEMNNKARQMNLSNTRFTNPIGFTDDDHYMSVFDIASLSKKLIEDFPQYYEKYFSIRDFKWNKIKQQNRNGLLFRYVGTDGLKTGHTNLGGYGLAVSSVVDGRRLIAVVNGANSVNEREFDAIKLLDYGYKYKKKFTLFEKDSAIRNVSFFYGKKMDVD
jgi:D-alanyl-D-alanine carboxypeptidase (penicillin-binding protein 5/6)